MEPKALAKPSFAVLPQPEPSLSPPHARRLRSPTFPRISFLPILVSGAAKAAEAVTEYLGGLDILVHNLGGSSAPGGGFAALTDETWLDRSTSTCSPLSVLTAPSCPG